MSFTLYHLYLTSALVSGFCSLCMVIILCQKTKSIGRNLISQALIAFGCFDLMGTLSWCLGNKYSTTFEMCASQEYIFQASNLFKATTTVLISCLACYVVNELKHPPWNTHFLKLAGQSYLFTFLLIGLNIYLQSASLFCGSATHAHSIAYVTIFLPPLYICVVINFIMYRVIRRRAKHIVQFFSVIYRTSSASMDAKLLEIVNKLRIYPNVFCLCWLPEVVYIILTSFVDREVFALSIISGIFINSSGTFVALCYLYHQYYKDYSTPESERDGSLVSDRTSSVPSSNNNSSQNPICIHARDSDSKQSTLSDP